jgi:hypothetical protein
MSRVPDVVLWLGGIFATRILLTAGYGGPYGSFFLTLPAVLAAVGLLTLADRMAPAIGPALPRLTAAALTVFVLARGVSTLQFYRRPGWDLVIAVFRPDLFACPSPWREPARGAVGPRLAPARRRSLVISGGRVLHTPWASTGRSRPKQFFPGHLDGAGEAPRSPAEAAASRTFSFRQRARRRRCLAFGTDYLRELDAAARRTSRRSRSTGRARPDARIGDPISPRSCGYRQPSAKPWASTRRSLAAFALRRRARGGATGTGGRRRRDGRGGLAVLPGAAIGSTRTAPCAARSDALHCTHEDDDVLIVDNRRA